MIRSVKNQYLGINAHLHSFWQARGGWNSFHTNHITDLMRVMQAILLPMGYSAELESSLQIRRLDEPGGVPESDVTIFDRDPLRAAQPPRVQPQPGGVLVLPISEALAEPPLSEKTFSAVGIYKLALGKSGKPVAWVELLSPSNKGGSLDADLYREKRTKLVYTGIVFVELDYLHETAPNVAGVANYASRRARPDNAHPYRISILDSRSGFDTGQAYIREFDVDEALPTLDIPLSGSDRLTFDFGVPYRKTFEETLYGYEYVDYSQLPLNFDRYSPADQARIAARLVAVLDAAQRGLDLESGPFPAEPIPLDAALARLGITR